MITPEDLLKQLEGDDDNQPKQKSQSQLEREERVKQVYISAHSINRAGRQYTKQDLDNYAQMFKLNISNVEEIFVSVFENHIDEFGLDKKSEIYKVELYLKKKYDFIKNEVTGSTDYKLKGERDIDYRKINIDSIYRDIQHIGHKFTMGKLESLLASDFVESYNPFQVYFDNLPKWDEVDHISSLAEHLTVTGDKEFFLTQFKKCLVRCIACSIGLKENRIVFVLVGEKQEAGKSTFLRFLNPFGNKYYTESPIRDNKDSEFRFAENFIYNLEELSSLNNIEINKLKAIISKSIIKERRPFGRTEEEMYRRCNFFGSTNKTEFLTDTENTRWLCFNLEYINWEYKAKIDINKVWAQAWHLYNTGFKYTLTSEERVIRDDNNKGYELSSAEKELILLHLKPDEEGEFMTNVQILEYLIEKTANRFKLNSVYLGRALSQLGFKSGIKYIDRRKFRGYFIRKSTVTDFDLNTESTADTNDSTVPF
jgi:predicted P-loop ATPase